MFTEDSLDGNKFGVCLNDVLTDIQRMIRQLNIIDIERAARLIASADAVLAFGNGGSHAIASHLVGDLMLRPGPGVAMAIGDNVVAHTAYANDYSFEESAALYLNRVFSGYTGFNKVLVVFSTSGESKNVMRVAKIAREQNYKVIALLGKHLHRLEPYADIIISVDGNKAGRIEAVHDAVCHAFAEVVPEIKTKGS